MSTKPAASILIVEDDPRQIRLYSRALRGYRLTCVTSGSAALKAMEERLPDLILLDHILADGEKGTDFLPRLKAFAAHVPVIVISGTLDIQAQLKALQGPGAAHYVIEKPVNIEELEKTVEVAFTQCGMAEAIQLLKSLENAEKIESTDPERRFVERLERQHQILQQLRTLNDKPNISALARDFGVSRKTIHRDLRDLIQRGQIDPQAFKDWDLEVEE